MGGVRGLDSCLDWVVLLGVITSLVAVLGGLLKEMTFQHLLISNTRIIEIGTIPYYAPALPQNMPEILEVNEKTENMFLESHWEPQHWRINST